MLKIERNTNDPIKFCHISPTHYLERYTKTNGAHLLLAHLVEQDEKYANYYSSLNDGKLKIMDNSAFEMYKQGRPMYDSSKLIDMANKCKADVVVLSDYPKDNWEVTRDAAMQLIPEIKKAGFGTFYVPQSNLGDVAGLLNSFEWAINNDDVDLIGVSILACPIAFGIDQSKYEDKVEMTSYKLQRFFSRWKMFYTLQTAGLLNTKSVKKFHCLGMMDGPNEIELLSPFHDYIYSWDSSAAIWSGLNCVGFDLSPTGLLNGKVEREVNFDYDYESEVLNKLVLQNISYIDSLCQK